MIPKNLEKLANGRDAITTEEVAMYFSIAPQTIRKSFCEQKSLYGIKPLKISRRLLWRVTDIAKLVNRGAK
jgi:hypothetical protein